MRRSRKSHSRIWFKLPGKNVLMGAFLLCALTIMLIGGYAYKSYLDRTWRYDDPFRLLFTDGVNHFYVMEVLVHPTRVGLILVPDDVLVDVFPRKYGAYRVGALQELGEIEHLDDDFMLKTLSYGLGMIIDDVVALPPHVFDDASFATSLDVHVVRNGLFGRINLIDAYRLWGLLREVKGERVTTFNLDLADVYVDQQNSEFLDRRIFNQLFLAEKLNQWQPVIYEGQQDIQIQVINTTRTAGLATSMMYLLNREGFQVIGVGDEQETVSESKVIVREDYYSKETILKAVAQLLDFDFEVPSEHVQTLGSRVDALFLIGDDLVH